jgi:hypothetical protein
MRKDDYIIIEYRTMNDNAEEITRWLEIVNGLAKRMAERNNKVYVVLRVVSIVLPDAAQHHLHLTAAGGETDGDNPYNP